ncbi:unnamed protein product, partial [Soboliphyme baturini]|uniref:VWFA domain-containing protein n=1 Tax=Soboliphyme baturini TaxID=241478 RepID=A0A183J941_9BILA
TGSGIGWFVSKIVDSFDVRSDGDRVAVFQLVHGSAQRTGFGLNAFATKKDILQYLRRNLTVPLRSMSGAEELSHIASNEFTAEMGDRPNVPNILIVIMDDHQRDTVAAPPMELYSENRNVIAFGVGLSVNVTYITEVMRREEGGRKIPGDHSTPLEELQNFIRSLRNLIESAFPISANKIAGEGPFDQVSHYFAGVNVECSRNGFATVLIKTVETFRGRIFLKDHFGESCCDWTFTNNMSDEVKVRVDVKKYGKELRNVRIPLYPLCCFV